jgi:hypothetical protein
MPEYTILYDDPQEAAWFRGLHAALRAAHEEAITAAWKRPSLQGVFAYDRPDVVLLADDRPILVVEETVEVPSGHNVGQRFARLAAAAEAGVPCLYFGPYAARKHGGITAGPSPCSGFCRPFSTHRFRKVPLLLGFLKVALSWG